MGIGDDAACLRLPARSDLLVTTDLFVEGIHFRRRTIGASAAGRRALCRALSDIAAMGGRPLWAFLSLALPKKFPAAQMGVFARGFLRGFAAAARSYQVALAGGDTGGSGSAVFLADVIVCGAVPHAGRQAPRGRAVLRSTARPGDALYISGRLGRNARALARGRPLPEIQPRLELGAALRRRGLAAAMIDVSDGLSTDLHHLVEESGTGAEIEAARIPRAGTLEQALHGGEDYELLFAARRPVPAALAGVPLTRIGRVVRGSGVTLVHAGGRREPLPPGGFQHFRYG